MCHCESEKGALIISAWKCTIKHSRGPLAYLRGNGRDKQRGKQKDRRGGTEEEEVTREGDEDVRGGQEGRRRGREEEGNRTPTIISKSRRLWRDLA